MGQVPKDPILEALAAVERAFADNLERADLVHTRIAQIRERRRSGDRYSEILQKKDTPLVVALITEILEVLNTAGHRLRLAEAEALYAEGLTMEQIADVFGVSRQRVSTLLRHRSVT